MKTPLTPNKAVMAALAVAMLVWLGGPSARAQIQVAVEGPGGRVTQAFPDAGGAFDVNLPLTKNAVNNITVTATDKNGNKASKGLQLTQVSLQSVVVSKVVAEPLPPARVEQLVQQGVIQLDNPANYNVSQFDIILTIGHQQVPISVPIATPKEEEQTGYEIYKLPKDQLGGSQNSQETQVVVFDQPVAPTEECPNPPRIPGVIVIEGRIKSLKEFYSVRLLLMNTSGIFTLSNVAAKMTFPDGGLTAILPDDGKASLGDIAPGDGGAPGQKEKEFIIRGDQIGVRGVKVDFGGFITGPGIPDDGKVPFNGSASTSVEVKGPPTFLVEVVHPDYVTQNVPYELKIDITNTGEVPALYTSLDLDIGGDAEFVNVKTDPVTGAVSTEKVKGPITNTFGHIQPGQKVSATFTINPLDSGDISSCMGISDQNITLQVQVGTIGCLTGHFPPQRVLTDGRPTVSVVPYANAFGVGQDSPVTAIFSSKMKTASIVTGTSGTLNVYDDAGNIVPGQIRFMELNGHTVAVWQVNDGITNKLQADMVYTVKLTTGMIDMTGMSLESNWLSTFTTTGTGADDHTPPSLTLTVLPPVNPNSVQAGQTAVIKAYAADQGSGVRRLEARLKDLDTSGSTFALIDQKSVFEGDLPPYLFNIDSARLTPGHHYQLMVHAYDAMGNAQNATIALAMAAEVPAPTISLPPDPSQPQVQGITLSITPQSIGGAVKEVRYYLDDAITSEPFHVASMSPWQASLGTLKLDAGAHTIRADAVDSLGRIGSDTYHFNLAHNPQAPTVKIVSPADGISLLQGDALEVSFSIDDAYSIRSQQVLLDGSPVESLATLAHISTTGLGAGSHTVRVEAVNELGNTGSAQITVKIETLPAASQPPSIPVSGLIQISAPSSGSISITGVAGAVAAGVKVRIQNLMLGSSVETMAGADGSFAASLEAAGGDTIRIVAINQAGSSSSLDRIVPMPAPLPVLTSVTVDPDTILFSSLNQTRQLQVTGHYDNGSAADLTASASYQSSNASVASVGSNGLVVCQGAGSAQITASYGSFNAQATVTANVRLMTLISASPTTITLTAPGHQAQIAVIGHFNDGTTETLTSGVSFATADAGIATASTTGIVTAVQPGQTSIGVAVSGVPSIDVAVIDTFAGDPAPTVQILSPADGTRVRAGSNVTVRLRGQDAWYGVDRLDLEASGAATSTQQQTVSPASLDLTRDFTVSIPADAAMDSVVTLTARALDTASQFSTPQSITLKVGDLTAPSVTIESPAAGGNYTFGDTVHLRATATDDGGVAQIRYATTGAFGLSGSKAFATNPTSATTQFDVAIPPTAVGSQVTFHVYAKDASNNESLAQTVTVNLDAPPAVAIASPANGSPVERSQAVPVTVHATDALGGGLVSVRLKAQGAATLDETQMLIPAATSKDAVFTLGIPSGAVIGGAVSLIAAATDSTGHTTTSTLTTLNVVDQTAPAVTLLAPAAGTKYNIGQTVSITVQAGDAVGVTQMSWTTSGGLSLNGSKAISPAQGSLSTSFSFVVPASATEKDVYIVGHARDAAGNVGNSIPVQIEVTTADITPPQTHVTSASNPGSGATSTIAYQIDDGLADLGHVELYFRRNGIGTFSRYTNAAGGNPTGHYTPQSGATGTIAFDSTKMGGDGTYEFYTVGVDTTGNREPEPRDGQNKRIGDSPTAVFHTGAAVETINQNIEISNADYDDHSLKITGATVTVVGTHSFRNVELLGGAKLVQRKTDTSNAYKLDLSVWTLTVDSSSSLDVSGLGYIGGRGWHESGRTVANAYGSHQGAGGSYGGLGGNYDGNNPAVPVYGDLTNPQELGSGGGAWGDTDGGDGGGLISLNAVNVVVDGAIRSDGGLSAGPAAGNGSGGGIRLNTYTLSGAGSISADGGGKNVGTGAGGGRIAIYYFALDTYDQSNVTTIGGIAQFGTGANGTVVFIDQAQANGMELVVTGQGTSTPYTQLIIPAGYTFNSVTLTNGARVLVDGQLTITDRLLVTDGSILSHNNQFVVGLNIDAAVVQVDEGSAIDVTGRGWRGGTGWHEYGVTLGNIYGSQNGSGGSYGGKGAGFEGRDSGLVYGDPFNPNMLGSGGGAWGDTDGGGGGGRLTIHASQEVIVNGKLLANGGLSAGSAAGHGSGGSILIQTNRLTGDGWIRADGGGTTTSLVGTAGGGGRISIDCVYVNPLHTFGDLRRITSFGGQSYYQSPLASAGTVHIKTAADTIGEVYIDNNESGITASRDSQFTTIGIGKTAAITTHTLTTDGNIALLPGGLVGLRINPKLAQNETFAVSANTGNVITVITPNENGAAFKDVASTNTLYGGWLNFDRLTLRRGGRLTLGDPLTIGDTLSISEYGMLTHMHTTRSFTPWLDVTTQKLNIDSTSRIDTTGCGYIGGKTWYEAGYTVGLASGSNAGAGGSHGGRGACYESGRPPGADNDSLTNPMELGSGGGGWGDSDGGDGGGKILIRADQVQLDGRIIADGDPSAGSAAGAGSGGTVNIQSRALTGSGSITANGGGNAPSNTATGGGGGRIALIVGEQFGLTESHLEAVGVQAWYAAHAGHGTIYIKRPGQTNGDLIIDGHGQNHPFDLTYIPGGYTWDNLTLEHGARVNGDAGLTVKNLTLLTSDSQLTHLAQNADGLALHTGSMRIDSGCMLNVDARGWRGGWTWYEEGVTQSGFTRAGAGAGGSYGGMGSRYDSGRPYGQAHGSLTNPVDLGSGGGAWGDTDGGAGGGRVSLRVDNTLTLNGEIRADGALSAGSAAAGGSGGTVNITANRVEGSGLIHTDGGGNPSNGVGGGGGRIAIACATALALPQANLSSVGKQGYYGGQAGHGTIWLDLPGTANDQLVIDGKDTTSPADLTVLPGGYTFANLTLRGKTGAIANEGLNVTGALRLEGGVVLTHQAQLTGGLSIVAGSVEITSGSAIDVSGRGWRGGWSWYEAGITHGGISGSQNGTGGSYGGKGGGFQSRDSGQVYGDPRWPDELGSGGGAWGDDDGGAGGGRVTIHATTSVRIDGAIRANGANGSTGNPPGAGSGGAILIETPQLGGIGTVSANGGGASNSASGGGGRIALHYTMLNPLADFGGLRNVMAFAGKGRSGDTTQGSAGTVYAQTPTQTNGVLYIDNNMVDTLGVPNAYSTAATPLTPIAYGLAAAVTTNTLQTDGLMGIIPNGLVGARLNPNNTQTETFAVADNTANVIRVVTPNEHGIKFESVAAAGKLYSGYWLFDQLNFRRGGYLIMADPIQVTGDVMLNEYGKITHYGVTTNFTSWIDLRANGLYVDSTGRIDATGLGYIGGRGWYESGRTIGQVYGSASGAGGSYGGLGGKYSGGAPNAVYGSQTNPIDFGSGGGGWGDTDGGNGGGLIFITATTIVLDGAINADGAVNAGDHAGSGSGGTVNIKTNSIAGGGAISAIGGGQNIGVGGGGGRIAVIYHTPLGLSAGNVTVTGGTGAYGTGQDGTTYLHQQ